MSYDIIFGEIYERSHICNMEAFTDNSSLQSNTNNSDLKSHTDIHTVEVSYKRDQWDIIFLDKSTLLLQDVLLIISTVQYHRHR